MTPYHLAARGDHAGLWDWNLTTGRVHYSPRWIAMVGANEHAIGTQPESWLTRVHPDDAPEVRRQLDEHLAGGTSEIDLPHRLLHKDGTYRWTSCHAVVVRDEGGRAIRVLGCHSDVTAERVSDALTGLPNRLLFMDHLARAIDRARRNPAHHFAVLLVDLGRPAPHDDGAAAAPDAVLTAAARRLETCLRTDVGGAGVCRDHLAARLRGDEFAVLLDGLADVGDAQVVAERLLNDLLAPFMVAGSEIFLPCSAGIAVSATGYTQVESVLRDADTALHRATLLGGGRCEAFDTAILRSVQHALQLDIDFMGSLGRGEFVLVYQPIVSLATRRAVGFEALVRWHHPAKGLIPPAEFIPIAERTGFIVDLGRWTLREACAQLAAWRADRDLAKDVWMSVNLSSPQFRSPTLLDDVTSALTSAGLPPEALAVELTEGVAMENPAAVKSLLMQMRSLGVRVAIDDFGTGQSSLAYLHQFPADKLKLDRSFVCDMERRADMRDIVGAVTHLAHQLGLEVIAEGVETNGQLDHARALGCEYVQGYLFSRPVAGEAAAAMLRMGFPEPACQPGERSAVNGPEPSQLDAAPTSGRRRARVLYAAAAAVAILALAGLMTVFLGGPGRPMTAPQPSPPVAASADASDAAVRGPALTPEIAAPAPAASSPAPSRSGSASLAVSVVHKHALRGCRGQLSITRTGLAYVPDKPSDREKDGFSLRVGEFEASMSAGELTVKSRSKTYRFKSGSDDARSRSQLAELGARVTSRPTGGRN